MSSPATATKQRQWITRAQTAARLQVSERYVDKLISQGVLTGYRLGRKSIRLDAAQVDALLKPIPTAGGGRA